MRLEKYAGDSAGGNDPSGKLIIPVGKTIAGDFRVTHISEGRILDRVDA